MSKVDISPEAVEAVAKEIAALGSREAQTMPPGWEDAYWLYDKTAATLRAQAERLKELEAENAILRTEKHADAEAIASARNNALREAAQIVGRYDEESTCPSCCDVTAINEEITALIEGATND